MRWTPGGRSDDLEDRRGQSGGGGGFNLGGGRLGIGGFLVLLVLSLVFKRDFLSLAGVGGGARNVPRSLDPTQAGTREKSRWYSSSLSYSTTHKRPGPRS